MTLVQHILYTWLRTCVGMSPFVIVITHLTYFATTATQHVGHLLYNSWQGSLYPLPSSQINKFIDNMMCTMFVARPQILRWGTRRRIIARNWWPSHNLTIVHNNEHMLPLSIIIDTPSPTSPLMRLNRLNTCYSPMQGSLHKLPRVHKLLGSRITQHHVPLQSTIWCCSVWHKLTICVGMACCPSCWIHVGNRTI